MTKETTRLLTAGSRSLTITKTSTGAYSLLDSDGACLTMWCAEQLADWTAGRTGLHVWGRSISYAELAVDERASLQELLDLVCSTPRPGGVHPVEMGWSGL
jgi:hypothetical protein